MSITYPQLVTTGYSVNECIGATVNQYLFDRHITKTRLAEALGIAQTNASKKVRGTVTWSAEDLLAAADLLEVDVQDLMPQRIAGQWLPAPFKPAYRKDPVPTGTGSDRLVAGAGFEPATSGL